MNILINFLLLISFLTIEVEGQIATHTPSLEDLIKEDMRLGKLHTALASLSVTSKFKENSTPEKKSTIAAKRREIFNQMTAEEKWERIAYLTKNSHHSIENFQDELAIVLQSLSPNSQEEKEVFLNTVVGTHQDYKEPLIIMAVRQLSKNNIPKNEYVLEIIGTLVHYGANINLKHTAIITLVDETPLSIVIDKELPQAVTYLLYLGASLTEKIKTMHFNLPPLLYAIKRAESILSEKPQALEIIKILLDHTSASALNSPLIKDNPFMVATDFFLDPQVIEAILSDPRFDPNIQIVDENDNDKIETPLGRILSRSFRDLHKQEECVNLLLSKKANPNTPVQNSSETIFPLFLAINMHIPSPTIISALLQSGADPNQGKIYKNPTHKNIPPLIEAINRFNVNIPQEVEIAIMLLKTGKIEHTTITEAINLLNFRTTGIGALNTRMNGGQAHIDRLKAELLKYSGTP